MPGQRNIPRQQQGPQNMPSNASAVSIVDTSFKLALPGINNITPENSSLMISSIDSFRDTSLLKFTTLMPGEDTFFGGQRIAQIDAHLRANTKFARLSDKFSILMEPRNFLAPNGAGVRNIANSIKAQYSLLNSIAAGLNSVRPLPGSNEEKFFRVQEENLKAYLGSLNYLVEKVIGGYLYHNAQNMGTLDPILQPLSDDDKDTYRENIDQLWGSVNPDFAAEQSRLILVNLGIQTGGPLGAGPNGANSPGYPTQDPQIAALREQNRLLQEQIALLQTQIQPGNRLPEPPNNSNPTRRRQRGNF